MTILDEIISYKREEVRRAKSDAPISALEQLASQTATPRGFEMALRRKRPNGFPLIAEIKKASPSKGLIRADFEPASIALSYQSGGAACLSVLTDGPSFQGSSDHLRSARSATSLPILRKDFMIDPYQVFEARAWGADCILLIMACLNDAQARELADAARRLGLDCLVETHDQAEVERAIDLGATMIGVNNRDLRTFITDLSVTERLAPLLPPEALLVSESGIHTNAHLRRLADAGAGAFLVGESLMRSSDIAAATRALLANVSHNA